FRSHVRLGHPGEPLDRRAVEADALGERGLELGRGHRHALQGAEHVSEPEPDKPAVTLLQRPEDELLLTVHATLPRHRPQSAPAVFPARYRRWPGFPHVTAGGPVSRTLPPVARLPAR